MCIDVHQSCSTCKCKLIHNFVCSAHIEHTHKQTDNDDCPDHQLRYIELKEAECHGSTLFRCHTKACYAFEVWDEWRHCPKDWEFCERRLEGVHACEDSGHFLKSSEHTCGVGRTVDCVWRHVKPDYYVVPREEAPPAQQMVEEPTKKENVKNLAESSKEQVQPKPAHDDDGNDVLMEDGLENLSLEDAEANGNENVQKPALKKVKLNKS